MDFLYLAVRGTILILASSITPSFAVGQPAFQNLSFESAVFVPANLDLYRRVQFPSAFPGWTGYVGGVPESLALTNNMFLNSSGIGLITTEWPYGGQIGGPISGNFTAFLQAGLRLFSDPLEPANAALAQTGFVPSTAQSLRFRALKDGPFGSAPGELVVTLGGQPLQLIELGTGGNYTQYTSDIHGWSGQVAELRFTATLPPDPFAGNNNWFLDSIVFSDVAVPESSSFLLLFCGLGVFVLSGRAIRQRCQK
jgi:hypothetical protein